MSSIPFSIAEAGQWIRSGETSALDLVTAHLGIIDSLEPALGAFITVCGDQAIEEASKADSRLRAGYDLGPLHGIPVAVKDNIDTSGIRTTVGSETFKQRVPDRDATVIRLLKHAGAIIIGKTNMDEFAAGGTTRNPYYGTTRNPWDLDRLVSGSSGGSAASVASLEALAALGTDTGGSIRLPAAMTGVTGLRPTFGRVSTSGVFPLAWTFDTVGPLGRSVNDVALILQCIAGFDNLDRRSSRRRVPDYALLGVDGGQIDGGFRIGVHRHYALSGLSAGVRTAFEATLQDLEMLGADVVDVPTPPCLDWLQEWHTIRRAETATILERRLGGISDHHSAKAAGMLIRSGASISAVAYLRAQAFREAVIDYFVDAFRTVDAFVTPTVPFAATPVEQDWIEIDGERRPHFPDLIRYTSLPTCIGAPALSVPCGFADGLPVGLQLMTQPFAEQRLLQIGNAYEAVHSWHRCIPSIVSTASAPD